MTQIIYSGLYKPVLSPFRGASFFFKSRHILFSLLTFFGKIACFSLLFDISISDGQTGIWPTRFLTDSRTMSLLLAYITKNFIFLDPRASSLAAFFQKSSYFVFRPVLGISRADDCWRLIRPLQQQNRAYREFFGADLPHTSDAYRRNLARLQACASQDPSQCIRIIFDAVFKWEECWPCWSDQWSRTSWDM